MAVWRRIIILRESWVVSLGGPCGSSVSSVVSGLRAAVGSNISFAVAHPPTLAASFKRLKGIACRSPLSRPNPILAASAAVDGHAHASFSRCSTPQLPFLGFWRGHFVGSRGEFPYSSGLEAAMARLGRLVPFAVRFVSTAAAAAPLPFQPTGIFVKVGNDGTYLDWTVKWDKLKSMRAGGLLVALAGSRFFGPELKDVKLSGCSVGVVSAPAEPDVLTEATRVSIVGNSMTVLDATTAGKCTGKHLFIHVHLPGTEPMGLYVLRHPSADAATARSAMHSQWQAVATRLERERKAMAKPAALHRDKAIVTAADATSLDLTVLDKDTTTDIVRLGVFKMPPVSEDTMQPPKGLSLAAEQPWFYLAQRAAICHEFLHVMKGKRDPALTSFGVLLSGPNGTGKSAIGVETALTCFARGMVSTYISSASEWVAAAKKGKGDGFLLERLLRQNADLVAAQPALREALAPALVLDPKAVVDMDADAADSIMGALRTALASRPSLKVGIIVDEVQTISAAVGSGMLERATTAPRVGAEYFLQWNNWDNRNRVFVRMDIASSHGLRDLRLPSGEQHRLCVIMPWTADVITAATKAEGSPFAFSKGCESARQRIVYTAGGIPRSILEGKRMLENALLAGVKLEVATSEAEKAIKRDMKIACTRWFAELGSSELQRDAAKLIMRLVRGEVEWDAVKGLYDSGIVARFDSTSYVKPVSNVAASVLMAQLAPHYRKGEFTPLLNVSPGAPRGYELETQVITLLVEGANKLLPAKNLSGDEAVSTMPARVGEAIPFWTASEVVAHPSDARLYVPTSPQFACNAITVPPTSAGASEPIVLWETSVTSPHDSARVSKVRKWFRAAGTLSGGDKPRELPAGIITLLRAAHPGRPIVCTLCWPDKLLVAGSKNTCNDLTTDAKNASFTGASVRVVVLDIEGLQVLGVLA